MSRTRRPALLLTVTVGVAVLASLGGAPGPLVEPALAQSVPPAGEFSMIFASDPQLPWWRNKKGGVCITNYVDDSEDDDDPYDQCIEREGRLSNEDLVAGMNSVTSLGNWPLTGLAKGGGAPVTIPRGVVMNGDLTSFFHAREKVMYEGIYAGLTHQMYPGLGNHDYQNNLPPDGCVYFWWWHPDTSRCAKEAVWWMTRQIGALPNLVRHDAPGFVRVYNDAAYNVRFQVDFKVNGSSDRRSTDEYEALQRRTLALPAGATDVTARIQGLVLDEDGLVWKTIATRSLGSPATDCFRATGTAFSQSVSSIDCRDEGVPGNHTSFGVPASGSLAYSFEIGGYHFVQLHNWPGYAPTLPAAVATVSSAFEGAVSPGVQVTTSYNWLRRDLEQATAAGKNVVLNMHDATFLLIADPPDPEREARLQPHRNAFYAAIRDQNVVGMFAGHKHEHSGLRFEIGNGLRDRIPVFYSGAAECRNFLYVDFHERHYNVGLVVAPGGSPEFAPDDWTCDTFHPYNSRTQGVPLTVDFNIPPGIRDAFVNTSPVREGQPADFFASTFDRDGDDLTFRWDFGDGQSVDPGRLPNAVHAYADEGTYTVTFTAEDGLGARSTRRFDVVVENVAPTLSVAASGITVDENDLATVSGTLADPGSTDAFELTVDWGDGPPASVRYAALTTEFSLSHRYADDNPTGTPSDDFRVSLSLSDGDGGSATATTDVRVNNVAPTLAASGSAIDENGVASVSGSISDPGTEDSLVVFIDWGDGLPEGHPLPAGTRAFSRTHRYLDDNPTGTPSDAYAVTLNVVDDDQGSGSAVAAVVVRNVPPVAAIESVTDVLGSAVDSQTPVVIVGQAITATAGATDVGTRDTHVATVDWGDGTVSELEALTPQERADHPFAVPGTYQVELTVGDDDRGTDADVRTVRVVDAAGGIRAAVDMMRTLASISGVPSTAVKEIEKAIRSAIGSKDGAASNGALDKLAEGDLGAALVKLRHVVESLTEVREADPSLDTVFVLRLVGLTAKSIATDELERAAKNAGGPADLWRIAQARALIAEGDRQLGAGAFQAATMTYRGALQTIKSLL